MRDKDGISAMVLACDLVAALKAQGRTVQDALDALARRHGVHTTTAVSRPVADADEAADVLTRLRDTPPDRLCGYEVSVTDLLQADDHRRTDALILTAGDAETSVRLVVRPSGTEPKVKSYIEVRVSCHDDEDLETARGRARELQDELVAVARQW